MYSTNGSNATDHLEICLLVTATDNDIQGRNTISSGGLPRGEKEKLVSSKHSDESDIRVNEDEKLEDDYGLQLAERLRHSF